MTESRSRFSTDRAANIAAYAQLAAPDPNCCLACASFVEAVDRSLLPSAFVSLLDTAGVDVRKPLEVWGEPEEGFLQGFYAVCGVLIGPPWSGQAEGAFHEPVDGFKYYMTEHVTMNDRAFDGMDVFQIEFTWEGEGVVAVGVLGRGRRVTLR